MLLYCPSTFPLAPYSCAVWTGTNPRAWDDSIRQECPREQDSLRHRGDLHLPSSVCADGRGQSSVHRQWHLERDSRMQMYEGARKAEASVDAAVVGLILDFMLELMFENS